jgi:diphthamide synthase (EF-2-diphthine--ammonia ligase)
MCSEQASSTVNVACCYTGGKDSTLVAHMLQQSQLERPCKLALLVLFTPKGGKPSFKAHPVDLIQLQAKAMQIPLKIVEISDHEGYLEGYRTAIRSLRDEDGIQALATGETSRHIWKFPQTLYFHEDWDWVLVGGLKLGIGWRTGNRYW